MHAYKILCPTDLSDCSIDPLEMAASLASDLDASLIVLHVVDDAARFEGHGYGSVPPMDDTQLLQELEQMAPNRSAARLRAAARAWRSGQVHCPACSGRTDRLHRDGYARPCGGNASATGQCGGKRDSKSSVSGLHRQAGTSGRTCREHLGG